MAIQIQGNGGTVAEVDGSTFRAVNVTLKPKDYESFGSYRAATTVALVVSQAANGTLFSFRWGDASRLCILNFIRLAALQTSAATATIYPRFQVYVARNFSTSDSAGTALTLTGNSFKKRTSMGTTLVTDIRRSAVAAGLTAGTRTLDTDPILEMSTQQTITTPNPTRYEASLDWTDGTDMPLVLAQNEGFIVRGPTTVFGAAGTMDLVIDIGWTEAITY
jgi:hypothetical protein